MMSTRIAQLWNRLGALAILLTIAASLVFLIVVPWLNWRHEILEEIHQTARKVAQFKAIALRKPAEGQPISTQVAEQFGNEFLQGDDPSLVLADLQAHISKIIADNQSQMVLAQQLPPKVDQQWNLLGINVQLRGDIRHVFSVFHTIEASKPHLFIENARIRLNDGAAFAASEGSEVIEILSQIDIYGVRWPSELGTGASQ